jgi:plastocyanin
MRRRSFTLLLIAAATAAPASGCGDGGGSTAAAPKAGASSSPSSSIAISDFEFSPATIRVSSGARVGVTNSDTAAHTVTADDGQSFNSGTVEPGASNTIQAPRAGTYPYHCDIHPFMKGKLVAQ